MAPSEKWNLNKYWKQNDRCRRRGVVWISVVYLWAQRSLPQAADRFPLQTEADGFSSRCPSLSPPAEAQLHHSLPSRHVCVFRPRPLACVCSVTHSVCPYLPEPVDLLAVLGVMSIDGVLLPVGQIDLLHPTQHQLQQTEWHLKFSRVSYILYVCVTHRQAEDNTGQDGINSVSHSVSPLCLC